MELQLLEKTERGQELERMAVNAKRASEFLKALAHESRLMILCILAEGEKSVSELEEILSLRQPTVSQLLARLRGDGLVSTRRDGKSSYYSLASEEARVVIGAVYDVFCRRQRKRCPLHAGLRHSPGSGMLAAATWNRAERAAMAGIDPEGRIFVGKSEKAEYLTLKLANRHGLVTGATGSGKTVTLQVLAEGCSIAGVPVFAADIKGDLSGIAEPGEAKDAFVSRAKSMGFDYQTDRFPVVFWDLFGEQGHPVRATISEMGPLLLARLLDLNDVQEGVLNIVFRIADEQGLLLLDLKDLRAVLSLVADNAAELTTQYGNVSKATVGTIQRQLLVLENQGGTKFFTEPALKLAEFMKTDRDGRGYVNVLA